MLTHGDQMLRDAAQMGFWGAFNNFPAFLPQIAERVSSTAPLETYSDFGYAPKVREMVGGRNAMSVPEYNFSIRNKLWENTVKIDYFTRTSGRGAPRVARLLSTMGRKARAYPDELASIIINSNALGYDGLALFHDAHVEPGAQYQTAQDNNLTADLVAAVTPTDLEFAAAARTMIDTLYGFKDGAGSVFWPADGTKFIAMVPTLYQGVANQVANNDTLTGPISNDLKGRFTVLVNPYLTVPVSAHGYWYMLNASAPERPTIFQVYEDVSMKDNLGGDDNFNTEDAEFGSFAAYNVGSGNFRTIVRMDFTT